MKTNSEHNQDIISQIRQGDTDAFARIYDEYVEPIYRFVFFKVSSAEVAQDLTSEAFTKVFQYIVSTSKKIKNIKAFIYRVARNTVIDHYRKRSDESLPVEGEVEIQIEDQSQPLEEQLDQRLALEAFHRAVETLKDDWQEIVQLRYIEGYSNSEIAVIVEKSEGSVRVILHRALKELKRTMDSPS